MFRSSQRLSIYLSCSIFVYILCQWYASHLTKSHFARVATLLFLVASVCSVFAFSRNHFNKIEKYPTDSMSKQIAQHSPFEIEFKVKVFVWASHCIETTSANKLITFVSIDLSVASRVPLFIAFDADLLTCKAQRYFITPFCHIRSECGKNKLSNWKLHPKQDHKKRDIWLFTVNSFFLSVLFGMW